MGGGFIFVKRADDAVDRTGRAGAVVASLYGYLTPIFGLVLSAIVFREHLQWLVYVGVPDAFAGVAMIQWAQRKKPSTARAADT